MAEKGKEYCLMDVSIDLIDKAQSQLAFLKDIDEKSAVLHQDHVIKNAIRRYETKWLPLLAKQDESKALNLEPPEDVHWVWHVHMLGPKYYIQDCTKLISKVPDHKYFLGKAQKESAKKKALSAWEALYPDEPFDVDYNNISGKSDYKSECSYDILAASGRQQKFFYHVSLPHYGLITFLKTAVERYQKFVCLKKENRDAFVVPMYDVDLIWHTHQVHPIAYRADTEGYLGYVLHHDDTSTDRSEGSKLSVGDSNTRELYKNTFGESFPIPDRIPLLAPFQHKCKGLHSHNKV